MRLLAPICRVYIGTDEFLVGDRYLRSVDVTLSEDARASKCSFEIYDPGLVFADKYFAMSFRDGGIQAPKDLLEDPKKSGELARTYALATATADTTQQPEVKAWLDTIAWAEGADYNVQFTGAKFEGFSDHPRQIRTDNGLSSDAAGRYQFLSTTWDDYCSDLDFSPTSQDQCAVRLLDKKQGALAEVLQGEAGVDAALQKISYEWASLPPYRYPGQGQYTNADIKAYYAKALAKYKSGGVTPKPVPKAEEPTTKDDWYKNPIKDVSASAKQTQIEDKAATKPVEVAAKGTEIIVEFGYSIDQLVAYHFIHIGTEVNGRALDTTRFEGQTIRWLMTRRTKNSTYGNITLKEFAEKVAKAYGFKLEMEGDGPTYQHLDQTGITDYELLLRECRAIGYSIQDSKDTLIIKPWRPIFTGFVITQDVLINIRFSDRADKDRQGKTDTAPATQASPDAPAADAKTKIDKLEGSIVQTKPEDSTGTGKANARDDWYNSAAERPGNSVLSAASGGLSETDLDTLSSLSSVTQAEALGQASTKSKATTDAESLLYGLTGSPTAPLTGSPAPESAKTTDTTTTGTNEKTGLPRQEIGSIDLIDGRAEAVTIQDESRRVKGYESSATIITTPEALTIAPGSIIGLSTNCVPKTFAREWRVGQVKHSLQPGQFRTSLDFYTPQAAKAGDLPRDFSLAGSSSSPVTIPPGRLLNPLIGNPRGTPYDPAGVIRDYAHNGIDLASVGNGQNVCAAEAGVVDTAANALDGYGNAVFIKHTGEWNGWGTLYAHLASISVSPGQTVTKGQVIGIEGNTGGYEPGGVSGGTHLHFELWRPDGGREDPEVYISPCPTGVYGQGEGYPLRCR